MYAGDFLFYELSIHKIFRYKIVFMEEWYTEKMTSEEFWKCWFKNIRMLKGNMFVLLMNFLMSLGWELMVNNYSVFYKYENHIVTILIVVHTSSHLEKLIKDLE